jgi:hypothetical protein
MLAYFGNLIESAGNDVATVLYEHDWINSSMEHKCNLVTMMVNANYPVKLKAGKIFDVNLPTFLFVSSFESN